MREVPSFKLSITKLSPIVDQGIVIFKFEDESNSR